MSGRVMIVGLGSSNEDHLSLKVYKILKDTKYTIYLRTERHPVVDFLKNEKVKFETFDYLYDTLTEYEDVYAQIASFLIEEAQKTDTPIVYAVPGHPMVAEKSVKNLILAGETNNVTIEIIGGESFIDTFLSRMNIDPIDGFIFLNGEEATKGDFNPSKHILIGQVYDKFIASELKLELMDIYPDEMEVWIVSNLGIAGEEIIKKVPLYVLDHNSEDFHHLSSVYIPKTDNEQIFLRQFSKLVDIVKILRSPNGCPWDREQSHQSLRKHLIEETYELAEAIDELDVDHISEELGDVLLQVILHAQIADEEGFFNIDQVIEQINKKLIRRHPHVFGDEQAEKADDALKHWQEVKINEKKQKGINFSSILDSIPKDLPAILKAYKIQKKAAEVNFDWLNIADVYNKLDEEIRELKEADKDHRLEELGDVLFSVINLSRFLRIDPEEALAQTNRKFMMRFSHIEKRLQEEGIPMMEASLEVMEKYWNEAKLRN